MAKVVIVLNDAENGLEMEIKSDEPMQGDDSFTWTPAQLIGITAVLYIHEQIKDFKASEQQASG